MEKEKEGCNTCMKYPCVLQEWSSDKGRKLTALECGDYTPTLQTFKEKAEKEAGNNYYDYDLIDDNGCMAEKEEAFIEGAQWAFKELTK